MADDNAEKNEIREVMAKYCFRLDSGDLDGMASLFTPDGVWETAFGTGTTRAGIVAQAKSIRAGDAPKPRAVHLCTNIVIELHGDTADVLSNWTTVQNSEAGPKIGSAGGYVDRMVKQGGTWFFAHRRIDRFIADGKW
jgi:ketosteroid isomerase-like protein